MYMRDTILVACLAFALFAAPVRAACEADVILVNGRIYTVDESRPWAQAVAVCGESIVVVGTDAQARALATPRTRVVDLRGRLVLPGFNDAHVHLIDGAEQLVSVNLRPAADERELARLLGDFAARIPKGRWILGGFWDHEAWPSKALPSHVLVDERTPDTPIFVQRLDGHMALANAAAMKLAGITRDTVAPEGGTIVRDAAGEPTGMFKDNAMSLISRVIPPATFEETVEKARAG